MSFPEIAGEGLGRGWEEREEGGRNGKSGRSGRGTREEREEREEAGGTGKELGRAGGPIAGEAG